MRQCCQMRKQTATRSPALTLRSMMTGVVMVVMAMTVAVVIVTVLVSMPVDAARIMGRSR